MSFSKLFARAAIIPCAHFAVMNITDVLKTGLQSGIISLLVFIILVMGYNFFCDVLEGE